MWDDDELRLWSCWFILSLAAFCLFSESLIHPFLRIVVFSCCALRAITYKKYKQEVHDECNFWDLRRIVQRENKIHFRRCATKSILQSRLHYFTCTLSANPQGETGNFQMKVFRLINVSSNCRWHRCRQHKHSKAPYVYIVRTAANCSTRQPRTEKHERLPIFNKCLSFEIICNLKDSCCS